MAVFATPKPEDVPDHLGDLIDAWWPEERPEHCSNCRHAVVFGCPDNPEVRCEMGVGKPLPLPRLIRSKPRSFARASECRHFLTTLEETPWE